MNTKFELIVNNYVNGNLTEFRNSLKKLTKNDLMRFCCFCTSFYKNEIDIFQIEKQFNK
jgi:hypothetical protein